MHLPPGSMRRRICFLGQRMPHTLFIIETCQQISDNRLDARVTCRRAHIRENPQSFHRAERRRAAPARVTLQAGSESSSLFWNFANSAVTASRLPCCEIKSEQSALKRPGIVWLIKSSARSECLVADIIDFYVNCYVGRRSTTTSSVASHKVTLRRHSCSSFEKNATSRA